MMTISSEVFNWDPSLLIPASYDLVWGTVAFLIVAGVIYKLAWPTFIKMLDERGEKIEEGLQAAERAKAEVAQERERLEDEMTEARREANRIRQEAQTNAKDIVADARTHAQDEAERMINQANRQIEADRDSAANSLRKDVGSLATDLAGRIVEANVADNDVSHSVIDRFLDELESDVKAKAQ